MLAGSRNGKTSVAARTVGDEFSELYHQKVRIHSNVPGKVFEGYIAEDLNAEGVRMGCRPRVKALNAPSVFTCGL